MVDAAKAYVEREEFESVKKTLETLTIRVEVLANDLHRLTLSVGDLAERMDKLEVRMDRLEVRMDRLEKTVIDGNTALMAAIVALGRPRPEPV
jgi:predicted nuclease with TOPRIM domain